MVDDTYTYHINQPVISQKNNNFTRLISEERTKTLELLKHLLNHSGQPLVICGPEGIGKSTLLKVLQEQTIAKWSFCMIVSSADLNFEKLQLSIMQAINQSHSNKQSQSLSNLFQQLKNQHKNLILLFDDAGTLAPGLINQTIALAKQHSALRLVFALTHQELELRNSSDTTINEGNFIEIPALTEQQCADFLYQIAYIPQTQLTVKNINDELITTIYQETQGIPGQMIAKFPTIDDYKNNTNTLKALVVAVMVLIVLAFFTQWFSNSNYNTKRLSVTEELKLTNTKTGLLE